MRQRRALLVIGLVALGACSAAPSAPTPGTPGSVPPLPSTASAGSSSVAGPTASRSVADLQAALLTVADLPAGFAIVPAQPSGATAASSDPQCTQLVTGMNTLTAVGSLRDATERVSGGGRGPFVDEMVDEMDSPAGAAAEQAQERTALASCSTLSITEPGQPPGTATFTAVPPPPGAGQNPVAFRSVVTSGSSTGFQFTQVSGQVGDVVVTLSFVATPPAQINQITAAALARAAHALTGATTIPS